jgi:phage tail-like protein
MEDAMNQVMEDDRAGRSYQVYAIRVRWDGRVVAGLSRMSALRQTTGVTEYREGGGEGSIRKLPGVIRYEPITLERGVTQDLEFDRWARASRSGLPHTGFRRDVTIDLLNEAGEVEVTYRVYRCWVSEYQVAPQIDTDGSAVVVESITLVNEGWERMSDGLSELFHLVEPATRLADLVTAGYPSKLLENAVGRVTKGSAGTVAILSGGDAGTVGAAIAHEAGVSMMRVDLGQVASPHIDETERMLDRVFERAADLGAVLLFDEADALFGKRTEVRSSHDRYANLEISSLLERIDRYPGLVLLATAGEVTLDSEVLRRVRFVIPGARVDTTTS